MFLSDVHEYLIQGRCRSFVWLTDHVSGCRNKSLTLPFENLKNIAKLALSPDQAILLSIDEEGRALLINFKKRTLLGYFRFKETVKDIQFSPDSR